jgi:hypothetical protein
MDDGPGTQRRPRLVLLLKAAPPEPPVLATATAPRSVPRTPTMSLLPVQLLHVYAQDKYHECIRGT